jgi:hypothetical protein
LHNIIPSGGIPMEESASGGEESNHDLDED